MNGVFTNQVILVTTAPNVQAYANTGLAPGVYRYSIRAVNGSAASAWTAWVQITIP